MSTNEIPGVYTSYEVSGSVYGGGAGSAVGLVSTAETGETMDVTMLTGYGQAKEKFGGNLAKLAEILFRNGAPRVYAVRVEDNGYKEGFEALMDYGDIRFMLSDSDLASTVFNMKNVIEAGDERSKYRIGVCEAVGSSVEEIVETAAIFNSERIMMLGASEVGGVPGAVAAAVCGIMAGETDPARPLNGAVLKGLGAITPNYSDADVTALILGGVSPIETLAGSKSIIRGVSTRTTTAEVPDATWREINTVLIVDEVIPAIRDGLRAKFARAKNTLQTRGAIRTQVMVALEDYLAREIIDSYGEINVEQSTSDPTVCLVNFAFAVAHGLNKIELRAHISV